MLSQLPKCVEAPGVDVHLDVHEDVDLGVHLNLHLNTQIDVNLDEASRERQGREKGKERIVVPLHWIYLSKLRHDSVSAESIGPQAGD